MYLFIYLFGCSSISLFITPLCAIQGEPRGSEYITEQWKELESFYSIRLTLWSHLAFIICFIFLRWNGVTMSGLCVNCITSTGLSFCKNKTFDWGTLIHSEIAKFYPRFKNEKMYTLHREKRFPSIPFALRCNNQTDDGVPPGVSRYSTIT